MKKMLIALMALVSLQASIQAAHAELVVVANPGVKLSSISVTQLTRIFLGQTGNFPDGNNAVPLDVGGDFRNSFYTFVLKKSPAQVERYWARMIFTGKSQPPREVALKDVKSLVAETSGAISYVDSSTVDSSVKVLKVTED